MNNLLLIACSQLPEILQVKELTGCDLLTISPGLLAKLEDDSEELKPKLNAKTAKDLDIKKIPMDEKTFRYQCPVS